MAGCVACLYKKNVKTAEPIGPIFYDGHDPREGLWMLKIRKMCLQIIFFRKILKIREKKSWNFCVIVIYCAKFFDER